MAEPRSIPALSGADAAQCLLAKLGVQAGVHSTPAGAAEETAETVLRCLERDGVNARPARIELEQLREVELPVLAKLKDARWLLVVRVGWRGVVAEDAAGKTHTVSWTVLGQSFDGLVLERILDLPHGDTLRSRLLRVVWKRRRTLYLVAALALAAQAFELIVPQLVRVLVDHGFPEGASDLLRVIIVGMVLVALFHAWISWLERYVTSYLQAHLDAVLQHGLFAHLLRLPYAFVEKKTFGQLMQAFNGISTARDLLTGEAMAAMLGGVTALAFLALMLQLMPVPTAMVACVGLVTIVIAVAVGQRQAALHQHYVEVLMREHGHAAELFTQITMFKAAGAENRYAGRWLDLFQQERRISLRGERISLGAQVTTDLLGQLQLQGLWIWGGLRVLEGALQLGELLAFTLMASAFHAAVHGLGRNIVSARVAMPQLRETQSLLTQLPLSHATRLARPLSAGPIEVRDIWFRYGDELPWIFSGMDLTVAPGEWRRIDGPSGFGKTTLLKLVVGLYEPVRGGIRVAGHTPHGARELMIHLPQFVRLFNASIMENLRIVSRGASRERLMEAAIVTGLAQIAEELPMGYETLLALGGENFSGGQRQLIALTAVLASARPILLLDEATANIDVLHRAALVRSPLLQEKTILYSSHDASSLSRRADTLR